MRDAVKTEAGDEEDMVMWFEMVERRERAVEREDDEEDEGEEEEEEEAEM